MNVYLKGFGISLINSEPTEISYISFIEFEYESTQEYEKKGTRELIRSI